MATLTKPSLDLATKITAELSFEEGLAGYQMSPATGNHRRNLYSFQEVVDFLKVGDPRDLLVKGGGISISYIDPKQLRDWIDRVFGDKELSSAIEERLTQDSSYQEQIGSIKELMQERLELSNAVLTANIEKEDQYA